MNVTKDINKILYYREFSMKFFLKSHITFDQHIYWNFIIFPKNNISLLNMEIFLLEEIKKIYLRQRFRLFFLSWYE